MAPAELRVELVWSPAAGDASVLVTPTQLAMILGGLDPAKARERRRYKTSA